MGIFLVLYVIINLTFVVSDLFLKCMTLFIKVLFNFLQLHISLLFGLINCYLALFDFLIGIFESLFHSSITLLLLHLKILLDLHGICFILTL